MKQRIWVILSTLLAGVAIVLFGNWSIQKDISNEAKDKILIFHQLLQTKIDNFKEDNAPLIQTLSTHPQLAAAYRADAPQRATQLFTDMIKTDPDIMQLRFIDREGNERIRIDRSRTGELTLIKGKRLQNKAHRDYFQTFIALKPGEISFSNFDLNIENKKVQRPFNPTLRAGAVVSVNGQKAGLIVVNYYMREWLERFVSNDFGDLYLVDEENFFLLHPDPRWAWSRYHLPQKKASDFLEHTLLSALFGETAQPYWVDERTYTVPLNFFGKKLAAVYRFSQAPSESYNTRVAIFSLLLLLMLILFLIPTVSLLRHYIRKIRDERGRALDAKSYVETLLNSTFDAIITIDQHGIIQSVNRVAVTLFGYKEEEFIGQNVKMIVPPPHHDKHDGYIASHDRSIISKVIGQERELFGRHKDGRLIPISLGITQMYVKDKLHFLGSIRDLSDEHLTQKLFQRVFSKAPLGIALALPDGTFWQINQAFADTVKYTPQELRTLNFQKITHPDDLQADLELVQKTARKEIDGYQLEKRYITKDGDCVWVHLTVSPIFSDDQKSEVEYFIAMIEDITERKSMITELSRTQEGLMEAERVSKLGHWDWDIKNGTLQWSEGMLRLFGETQDSFGHTYEAFLNLVHPDDRDVLTAEVTSALDAHLLLDTHYRIITPSGEEKHIHALGHIDYDQAIPVRMFGTCQDITTLYTLQKKEQQQEMMLLQQSKLAAMGEMLGAIAHQWRQPLNSIGLIIQDLVSAHRYGELDEAYFKSSQDDMMQQLHYMSNTIDEFRNFFTQSNQLKSVAIPALIEEIRSLYWAQLNAHNIRLKLYFQTGEKRIEEGEDDTPPMERYSVTNYPAEIKQLLLNLIVNAKEAIEKVQNPHAAQLQIDLIIASHSEGVTVEVKDLAGGIDPDVAQRIFEPYFTTKEMGTGLGLYIAKTLVDETLKGQLSYTLREEDIDGKPYRGAIFSVTLPHLQ